MKPHYRWYRSVQAWIFTGIRFSRNDWPRILLGPLLICLSLTGCATTGGNAELAWQAANIVDTGQTVTVAREPDRWREAEPVTKALGGAHPSETKVYEVMAVYAVAHYATYRWLDYECDAHPDSKAWPAALSIFESLTFAEKAYDVGSNVRFGIGLWGKRD